MSIILFAAFLWGSLLTSGWWAFARWGRVLTPDDAASGVFFLLLFASAGTMAALARLALNDSANLLARKK